MIRILRKTRSGTKPGTVQSGPVPAKALELLCRGFCGNAAIRRAYADCANPRLGRHQSALADNGVDLIQVTRAGTAGKNAADIRMAVDAMEALITHPEIAVFILVSGDSDYSPLVQRLREFGKHVVGVGTEANASRRLVSVCSEYNYGCGSFRDLLTPVAHRVTTVDRSGQDVVIALTTPANL